MADDADRATEHQERLEAQHMTHRRPRPITRVHDWCIACGEPIERLRLKAIPDAARCAECQSDYEKYESQYGG